MAIDKYGRETRRGDCVAYKKPYYSDIAIGLVDSFTRGGNPRVFAWSQERKQYIGSAFAVPSAWIKADPIIQQV